MAKEITLADIATRLDAIEKLLTEQQNEDSIGISVRQAAKKLGVSEDTARSWARSGFMPSFKKNGRIVVSLGVLRRWADEQAEQRTVAG